MLQMFESTIEAEELNALLHKKEIAKPKLLFTTMEKAPVKKPEKTLKQQAYIPNSVLFDFESNFVDESNVYDHMMPSAQAFMQKAKKLGIQQTDNIVVYDDFGNFCASRVWFMLKSMEFTNVRVLNGGLVHWLSMDLPTDMQLLSHFDVNSTVKPANSKDNLKKAQISVNKESFRFVDASVVLSVIKCAKDIPHDSQIIDARSPGRFYAREAEPREGMRSGHIPTSVNIHYASLLNDGHFVSTSKLEELIEPFGLSKNQQLIMTCGSGVTACIVAQAFFILGYKKLAVYDASWSEWGGSESLPVETE